MHSQNFTHDQVLQFFKEVAFELDQEVFLEKIEQAISEGLDLQAPSPFRNDKKLNGLSIIEALINVADEKPRRTLIRKYTDPLTGLLKEMEKASTLAYAYLQVIVEDGLGNSEESVFQHILQGPMSKITPGLLYAAHLGGADTSPPQDTNWFRVLAENTTAFQDDAKGALFSLTSSCGWEAAGVLLDLDFDPCTPSHLATDTMNRFNELIEDNFLHEAPDKVRKRLISAFEAFELKASHAQLSIVQRRIRF